MSQRWVEVAAIRAAALVFVIAGPIGWLLFFMLFRHAPAQDLMVFHTAGRLATAHDWPMLRDGQAFTDLLNRTHADWLGAPLVLHPWVYPPPGLLLAALVGSVNFTAAYVAFMATSLALLGWCLWHWWTGNPARLLWLALVALCPATAFCVGSGQLTFLVAALILWALMLLPAQEFAAGCLLGLLFVKPQFGLMIPVALLAGRYWRAVAGAAASTGLLILLSLLAFGMQPWRDWARLMFAHDPAFAAWMETGRHFGQSLDTCVRLLGASGRAATLAQLLAIAVAAAAVWFAFARPLDRQRRGVVLLCAAVLAAPHVGNYDAVLTGIAGVTTLARGLERRLAPGTATLAAAAWLGSLINPPALIALLGVPVLTAASLATPLVTAGLMLAMVF